MLLAEFTALYVANPLRLEFPSISRYIVSYLILMPYHVRITSKDPQRRSRDALALDKDERWIDEYIVTPRRRGRNIFIDGQVFSWDDVDEIHISHTDQTSQELIPQINARRRREGVFSFAPDEWFVAYEGREVTEQFISGSPGEPQSVVGDDPDRPVNRKAIMVICGHDKEANRAIFDWLRAVGLQPQEFTHLIDAKGEGSPYIDDVIRTAFNNTQAVIAFFTPDEYAFNRSMPSFGKGAERLQARPNVMIEAGMALITHPSRTILVVLGDQELPSDLAGRHYVRLNCTDPEPLNDLAQRLRRAGCDIDTSAGDWLRADRFPDRDHLPKRMAVEASSPPVSEHSYSAVQAQYPTLVMKMPQARELEVGPSQPSGPAGRDDENLPSRALTGLWHFTSNGFEGSPAMDIASTIMPGYHGTSDHVPFIRLGFCIACEPLPSGARSSSVGAKLVNFLSSEPFMRLIHNLTYASPVKPWMRLAGNGVLRLDAMLRSEGEGTRPGASAMLLLPQEKASHYSRDNRFACLWLHVEPKGENGEMKQPVTILKWSENITQALDLASNFSEFLDNDIGLSTRDNPSARMGVMLQAPITMGSLVDSGDLAVLPGAVQSNQFLGYAIADSAGKGNSDTARGLIALLCDHTMHLDDFERVLHV